jgi:hypothetical protein
VNWDGAVNDLNPDPIFAAIGAFQASLAVSCHTRCATADAAQARAERALISTRATTSDGLHSGMCFRIEAVTLHMDEAEHEAADLMWCILSRAAARKPVAKLLSATLPIVEGGFFSDLLHAALRDALELELGGDVITQNGYGGDQRGSVAA